MKTKVPRAPIGSALLKPNVYFLFGLLPLAYRAMMANR